MTIRYSHIRLPDGEQIANRGGATVAYVEIHGCLCMNVAYCSDSDNFDREIGRKVAAERLRIDGPVDVIEAKHPRSVEIIEWASANLYDTPVTIASIGKHWVIVE